jgi:predicted DNA repair protein MutK
MPIFLKVLSVIGTAAMIWVGGGIIIHGLEEYGAAALGHGIHDVAEAAAHAVPAIGGAVEWLVSAGAAGIVGLLIGAALIPFVQFVVAPIMHRLRGSRTDSDQHAADAKPAGPRSAH